MPPRKSQPIKPYLAQNGQWIGGADPSVPTPVTSGTAHCPTCHNITHVDISLDEFGEKLGVKRRSLYDGLTVMHQCGFEIMMCFRHQDGVLINKILVMPKCGKVFGNMAMAVTGEGVDPDSAFEDLINKLWHVEDPIMKQLMERFKNAPYKPLQTKF